MAKARIGLYNTKGDTLARTHKTCPKCGPGTFLADHSDRRSCGKCGYMESRANEPRAAAPVAGKPEGKPAKAKAPKAPGGAPKPSAPAAPSA